MKHKAAVVGLVIFVLIDGALFLALRTHLDRDQVTIEDDGGSSSAPATKPAGAPPAATGKTSLTLSADGALVKVWRGQCVDTGQPKMELSNDAGKTFEEIALPLLSKDVAQPSKRLDTVRTILSVRVESPEKITVIASDEKCESRRFDTVDRGASWTASTSIDSWFVDAAGTGVVSPIGASEPGCGVVALSPVSDRNAKVACANGAIVGTDDNGEEWVSLGELSGVQGLTMSTLRDGFAIAPDDGCEARAFITANAGGEWVPAGCVAQAGDAKSLVGTAGALFALVDDSVYLSKDAGKTWANQSKN